jgi:hypothetical protein
MFEPFFQVKNQAATKNGHQVKTPHPLAEQPTSVPGGADPDNGAPAS